MEIIDKNLKNEIKSIFFKESEKKIYILLFLLFLFASNLFKNRRIVNKNIIPKISVFLPVYNKAYFLKRSIRSIRIQTLREIEIIPVNDCSEDNTLKILKKMEKKDSRIKIINNINNRGLLYSRAMGILNSKGEYLMNLDPDDELENRYNLEYLYKIANKYKVDVVSFGHIIKNGFDSHELFLCSNFNNILFKPQIFNFTYKFDYLITNKLVKKQLFIKAYELFKNQIYGEKWNYGEDEIWSCLINKYANSKICIDKAIYIYHINNNSLLGNKNNFLYMKNLIYWIEMFKKILITQKEQIYFTNRLNFLISLIGNNNNFLNIIKNNKELRNKFIIIFKNSTARYKFKNHALENIIDSLEN
jgi:glycosyltransferase involved in cell wall biosynthesis